MSRPRIVSLVPSATETLVSLGADVAACTRFCEQPGLPHVGGTKNPDIVAIVALAPDIVVVDEEENRREDAAELVAAGLELVVTAVRTVDDALAAVEVLARCSGTAAPATWPASLPPVERAHRAFVPIWRRPWMSINADTYGASVLATLGVELVTAAAPDRYPMIDLSEIAEAGTDLVLVPSEPYAFADDHVDELRAAVPGADVRRVDGQDLFWWGVRTPRAVDRLGAQLAEGSGPARLRE